METRPYDVGKGAPFGGWDFHGRRAVGAHRELRKGLTCGRRGSLAGMVRFPRSRE